MNKSIRSIMRLSALTVGAVAISGLTIAGLKPLTASASVDDKVFTHEFRNAAPAEVLAWMKKEGLRVDIDETLLPMRTLNLVFSGADADGVVSSFAKTIGFQAEKRGDVFSLLRNDGIPYDEGSLTAQDRDAEVVEIAPEALEIEGLPLRDDDILQDVMRILSEAGISEQVREKVAAKLEKRLAERAHLWKSREHAEGFGFVMPDIGEIEIPEIAEFDFEMPEIDVDLELDEALEFEQEGMGQESVMRALEQARAAIERAMAELSAKGAMTPGHGRKFRFDAAEKAEMKKHMAELERHMKENGMRFKFQGKDVPGVEGRRFEFHGMDKENVKKHMAEMEKHMQELQKQFGENGEFKLHMKDFDKEFGENMKVLKIKMENIKKFVKSLTKEQKARAEKQGYLRPEDLTKEQRELLGVKEGDKDFDMNFNMDGDSIRIKSGKGEVMKTSVGLGA